MDSTLPDLPALLASWQLAMRAERKAPGKIKTYTGVTGFLRWCDSNCTKPELTKPTVQRFIADLLDSGAEAATVDVRYKALKRFAAWLVDEGEPGADPLVGSKAPRVDRKVVHELTDDQLRLLIKACEGKSLRDRRDAAMCRSMAGNSAVRHFGRERGLEPA